MSPILPIVIGALAGAAVAFWPRKAKAGGVRSGGFSVEPQPVSPLPELAARDFQTTCDPTVKPGTARFRDMMIERFAGQDWGITRDCNIGSKSEHKEGRAFDWHPPGSPKDQTAGWQAVRALLAPDQFGRPYALARKWGIMYLVWDGHSWYAADAAAGKPGTLPALAEELGVSSDGWRVYSRTGNATVEHRDHVHLSLSREAGRDAPLV